MKRVAIYPVAPSQESEHPFACFIFPLFPWPLHPTVRLNLFLTCIHISPVIRLSTQFIQFCNLSQGYLEKKNQHEVLLMHMKRFVLRNWLTSLWKLASPKPAGWASSSKPSTANAAAQVQELSASRIISCLREVSLLIIKSFSCSNEAHPHYGGWCALLQVH